MSKLGERSMGGRSLGGRSVAGSARAWLLRGVAAGGLAVLAACGGGGGVNGTPAPIGTETPSPAPAVTPTPAPAPTPTPVASATPTPTTTPTPGVSYDTAEYRATVGSVSMNALAAYNVGATGAGVTVGIIDSGIDATSAEFENRIAAASQNVAGGTGIQDQSGHGTAVAFTVGGRSNGGGTEGVAFRSTLLVLRADTPGSCAATPAGSSESGCSFNDDTIGKGIDVARANGARVINISLGGNDYASPGLVAAANRATAAGIVIVIAAGNDAGAANPENSAQFANDDSVARNLVIVAGSVGANASRTAAGDAISSFSNRAGNTATHFLTAVGERVRAPDQNNVAYLWSGTSFAAPQISGAVALLAQAFPNLTGAQIVSLLYATARDAGAPGVDPIYGEGVLDLTRAFQPVGTTTIAGSAVAASATGNGALSAAMGDAATGQLGAVILDGYNRAFAMDLAQNMLHATPAPMLAPALLGRTRNLAMAIGGTAAAVTLTARPDGDVILSRTRLSSEDARTAGAVAATVTQRLGRRLSLGMGLAQGANVVTAQLAGQGSPAFLVAQDDRAGFDSRARASQAMRVQLGGLGLAAAAEQGDVLSRREAPVPGRGDWRRSPYRRTAVTLDGHLGPVAAMLGGSLLDERDTVLGAHFDASLGAGRAASWFADARARLDAGNGWSLGGAWRRGWTRAAVTAGAGGGGLIRTSAVAADIGKDGLFGHDSAGLRIARPLRVMRGSGIDLVLPTEWSYEHAGVTGWTTQRMNLAPTGHELDLEARYGRPWLGGLVQTNLFWRRDPGNVAGLAPDYGLALRWATGF